MQLDSIQTLSSIRQFSVIRHLQCLTQCYLGTAVEDKDSRESHSQLIRSCTSFPCITMATIENEKDLI